MGFGVLGFGPRVGGWEFGVWGLGVRVRGLGFRDKGLGKPFLDCRSCTPYANPAPYRGTSLIRSNPLLGPYRRTIPRALWWSLGWGLFLVSEVPLY